MGASKKKITTKKNGESRPSRGNHVGGVSGEQLFARARMINRIHTALRSTLQLDDIYSITLSSVISRAGLDFSRAVLFAYDRVRCNFHGIAALGAPSREDTERLHKEIAEEEKALANMVRDLKITDSEDEEHLFNQNLRELSNHSFWISTYQKFNIFNQLPEAAKKIEIPYHPSRKHCARQPEERNIPLIQEIVESMTPHIISAKVLKHSGLPRELTDQISGQSIWVAIHTSKGPGLILMADKIHQSGPITPLDRMQVDWFASQVGLTLSNAEMYKDLESAYHTLRDVDKMKSNFLSTISHELRTPLTAINGYTQLVMSNKIGPLSTAQREVVERIYVHGNMLIEKVNDLIEIAELDSGQTIEVPIETIDPLGALMEVLPRLEGYRAAKGISIEPKITGPIPSIRTNEDALKRILYHVISNAIKFGRSKGFVHIQFEIREGDLAIHITDDGIGISRNQLDNIFEAFYQVDHQLTRSYEGLGLGLAIIKKLLDISGGRIEVVSEPTRGSCFTIIYPLA